jgi:hypothetical protein
VTGVIVRAVVPTVRGSMPETNGLRTLSLRSRFSGSPLYRAHGRFNFQPWLFLIQVPLLLYSDVPKLPHDVVALPELNAVLTGHPPGDESPVSHDTPSSCPSTRRRARPVRKERLPSRCPPRDRRVDDSSVR